MRNEMQAERDAPFFRISATTGTTEQLHSGTRTPTAALVHTDFRLSSLSHLRIAVREISTWMRPARNRPRSSIGDNSRNDAQRTSNNRSAASNIPEMASQLRSLAVLGPIMIHPDSGPDSARAIRRGSGGRRGEPAGIADEAGNTSTEARGSIKKRTQLTVRVRLRSRFARAGRARRQAARLAASPVPGRAWIACGQALRCARGPTPGS